MARVLKIWKIEHKPSERREGNDTLKAKYAVKVDDIVSWTWLRRQTLIPKINDEHPTEPGLFLESIDPEQKRPLFWELDCSYSVFEQQEQEKNPLDRPATVTIDSQLVEQATLFDAEGRPITNTAGEFIPGLSLKVPLLEYKVVKNIGSDPPWIETHVGSINKDPVILRGRTRPPKTLFLASFGASEVRTENRQRFSEYSLTLLYDRRGWTEEIWNRGTVHLQKKTFTKWKFDRQGNDISTLVSRWVQVPIRDAENEKVTEPVALDLFGQPVQDFKEPDTPIDPSKLITLKIDLYNKQRFADLPLR